jgi:hypothetical protein
MDEISNAGSASPGGRHTDGLRGSVQLARWLPRLNSAGIVAALGVGMLWLISHGLSSRSGNPNPEEMSGYAAPLPAMPIPKPIMRINNETANLQLRPALDRTAVIYPEEVSALVGTDGHFKTDLPAGRMALLLGRKPQDIARRDSTSEIDPDIVLFIAVAGRLTEQGKEWSRHLRDHEAREGVPQSGAGFGWVKTTHPFTLRSLNSPTPEQKEILDAISRAARVLPRQPGAKINAIGLPITGSDMTSAEVEFAGGFLPLELPVPTR